MAQARGIVMLQPGVGGSSDSLFFAGVDKSVTLGEIGLEDTLVMKMKLDMGLEI